MPVHKHPIAIQSVNDPLVNIPLDHALISRLQASYGLVREHDLRLAEIFYNKLFSAAPHLRTLFRSDPQVQARKLISTLDIIVDNLANPRSNAAMLAALGRRHADYGAKPEHYSMVIDLLVESMAELIGQANDRQAMREWRTALRLISEQMIAGATSSA